MVVRPGRQDSDVEFRSLLATIERKLQIRCSQYKEDYIRRRLLSRMNATRSPNYQEYHKLVNASADERELLKNALTINVTKFLRDPEVFEVIRRDILPAILKDCSRIRIWSAGCSSGEEPYTLGILLYELNLTNKNMDAIIYATDIDDEILRRAKEGVYDKATLENLSDYQIKRHFNPLPSGKYEVKPHIRERVRFQHHDLMSGVPVGRSFDIVTCRNVTIYFNEPQKNAVTRLFAEALSPGGFYVMGMSEYLGKEVEPLFKSYKPLQKIYRKTDTTQ